MRISNETTSTMSDGAAICANCGLNSCCTISASTRTSVSYAYSSSRSARSTTERMRFCSISVSGRFGLAASPVPPSRRSIAANVIGSGNCSSAAPGSGFSERMTMYDGFGSERTYSSYVSCSTFPNVQLAPARSVVASTVES